ncbi:MAG: diguanylate cyclase [Actinomycetota bacterium]|nr:diguanylate cyclase [Actinomycetota bacterium]
MTDSTIRLPPGELQRLAECVLEPIRFPGAVQAHGALLAATGAALTITHASESVAEFLGAEPIALFGRPLADLIGEFAVAEILDVLDPHTFSSNPVRVDRGTTEFDVIVHRVDGVLVIEFEPLDPDFVDQNPATRAAFRRLTGARTVRQLWIATAIELSRITGFDRVMVYHFHPDEHGEVVAEVAAEGMEPYLGLHYPASDIPAQARALYLTKLSRMIATSTDSASALLADANSTVPTEFDLSGAELRAVSPHHLEFMRNMGQASTFSLSLVQGDRLVGMITCAHRTERRLPYRTREALEILANQVSLQLASMVEIDRLEQLNALREVRARLLAQIGTGDDLPEALLRQRLTLLDLVPADGAVIAFGGRLHTVGSVPVETAIIAFVAAVRDATGGLTFSSNAIPLDFPELAAIAPSVVGVMIRPFGRDGEFVAWFRGEMRQTVDWLGDMSPSNRVSTLSPRNSFSAWREEVTGTSAPWAAYEVEVGEFCRDMDSVLLRRAESELAELALRDALTGLPNRRLLMDRLGQGIARHSPGHQLAVLFIDLDGFKRINDTHGHGAGDDALLFVARQLDATARHEDTVARLGGDEFVILCENTTPQQAKQIAERILTALTMPPVPAPPWTISASIGIAMAQLDLDASHLLSAADAAMYRAKVAGPGRIEF